MQSSLLSCQILHNTQNTTTCFIWLSQLQSWTCLIDIFQDVIELQKRESITLIKYHLLSLTLKLRLTIKFIFTSLFSNWLFDFVFFYFIKLKPIWIQFINTFQQPYIDEYKTNVKHPKIRNHSMWQKSYKGENGSLLIFYHWTT